MKTLVFGIGVNDAGYPVRPKINGKKVMCSFYMVWANMLKRCYCASYQKKNLTYKGCSVSKDWLSFACFKSWMEQQDWQGKQLDKDILVPGNKIYSPHSCVFVDGHINKFVLDRAASRGDWPVGVHFFKRDNNFQSYCKNPVTGKCEHLGYFICPDEAHAAWRRRKHEFACQLANTQSDPRVANALRERFALIQKSSQLMGVAA
ncbi:hypothetical protein [Arsukibacterium indicum]|uniref:Uncharacterized protein n=1 Tax=Arsukibacterium indicum TaxID=2848612 RepID=A0ABS6MHU2_9GAMM|nr:hypothetical protein [Arsukibacterium indicum]MBV2128190.1 hypothetical protein [Arsukibacterium indicum]